MLLGLLFILQVSLKVKAYVDADKILKTGRKSRYFIYNLLRTNFRTGLLLRAPVLPFNPMIKQDGTVRPDVILVMKGGVFVISVKRLGGFIDNPYKGDWFQYINGRCIAFPNSFDTNETNTKAVYNVLKHESINNIRIHNVVVFTNRNVRFKYRNESLMSAETLLPYIKNMNKNTFLSHAETVSVLRCLRKYRLG